MMKTIDQKFEFATHVRAEPECVYDALATGEGLDEWFTKESSVDARPGGKIKFRWETGAINITRERMGGRYSRQIGRALCFSMEGR